MEVYLDNAATTACYETVRDTVGRILCENYGNPSSLHRKGFEAEKAIKQSKERVAHLLRCQEKELVFTSGGTESNNLALIGCARANRRRGTHLITTQVEHPSVLQTMKYLEQEGFRVTYLPVDTRGEVSRTELKKALCRETILVSVMYVNNEVGTKEPVEEIAKITKEYNREILVHTDGVQGIGKYSLVPQRIGIDLLTASGHKFHGPKGVGFLYVREGVKLHPILFGGGQQKNLRSGTENVPGIVGLAQAMQETDRQTEQKNQRMREYKMLLAKGILTIADTRIHGFPSEIQQADDVRGIEVYGEWGAPHIVSAGFAGVRSEVLLHALEERGIYVSAGSACSSNHPSVSGVLKGMGVPGEYLESTLRFSMSEFTTREEIEYTLEMLRQLVPLLRKYTRR